jgi:hypothetical protein
MNAVRTRSDASRRLSIALVAVVLFALTACAPAQHLGREPRVPPAPKSVTAVAGDGEATVTWAIPVMTGGEHVDPSETITGYTVTSSDGTTMDTEAAHITFTGLTNGTAYTFTVTATNANGTSPASQPSNEVIPAAP